MRYDFISGRLRKMAGVEQSRIVNPKYCLLDFYESKTVEVLSTSNVVGGENIDLRKFMLTEEIVNVRWVQRGKSAKKKTSEAISAAKILQLHGKHAILTCYAKYNKL